jgi:hypothetical protein
MDIPKALSTVWCFNPCVDFQPLNIARWTLSSQRAALGPASAGPPPVTLVGRQLQSMKWDTTVSEPSRRLALRLMALA